MIAPFATAAFEPVPWVKVEVCCGSASIAVHCSRCRGGAFFYFPALNVNRAAIREAVEAHARCPP